MKTNHEFYCSGDLIASVEIDKNLCYEAAHRGLACIYGRYELGRSYVARISDGKPVFGGFSAAEKDKIEIVNKGGLALEDEKYYVFRLMKIDLGFCRTLLKIKFEVLKQIDLSSLK